MESRKLIINNKINQLSLIHGFLEQLGADWLLEPGMIFELNLILEEYISNLIFYGYPDDADHVISIEMSKAERSLTLLVTDDGMKFNILEAPGYEDIEKPVHERKIGGLGIHFIKSLTDHIEYESDGEKNKLVIVKNIQNSQKKPGGLQ